MLTNEIEGDNKLKRMTV